MKFSCGKSEHQKLKDKLDFIKTKVKKLRTWHKIFLWLPTTIGVDDKGNRTCAWLCFVERRYPYAKFDEVNYYNKRVYLFKNHPSYREIMK